MASTEHKVVSGVCPDHGMVHATKDVPRIGFPFIVYGVRRAKAALAPARCPHCGAKLRRA
ncbi:MAG TPA: hypothetical protein VL337_15615 [Acidimicrobiales bacterium]|jgi:hypothetical protein|nr:hypothetical protein [Acidimicrobiales bacterium]